MSIKKILEERNIPPLLINKAGEAVDTPEKFEQRREEIKKLLQYRVYGNLPPKPDHMSVEVVKTDEFARRTAILSHLVFSFEIGDEKFSFPATSVIPKAEGKHPAFVSINFSSNVPNSYQPTEDIIDRGYALFSFAHKDVTSDDGDFENGCAPFLCKTRKTKNATGKIAIWAWAAMRMLDYALTLDCIDADNIAVIGHSRLGKTALLAGGLDERFKYVISNDSGCSGAAIDRGGIGEDIPSITRVFPFWFCPWYADHAAECESFEFDQHYLIALSVPRHILVGSAELDTWADPTSEFLGLAAVNEAYALYGMQGLVHADEVPTAVTHLDEGDAHYHIRKDGHYLSRHDWNAYMDFIDKYIK